MAETAQANGRTFPAPYAIPWKTFETFVAQLHEKSLPPRIDSSVMPRTMAGGVQISEHLPRTAKQMDKVCVVRSVTHNSGCMLRASIVHRNCSPIFRQMPRNP